MRKTIVATLAIMLTVALFGGRVLAQEGEPPTTEPASSEAAGMEGEEAGNEAGNEAETKIAPKTPVRAGPRNDPGQRDLDAYRLRVGDQVQIVVYQSATLNQNVAVPANGDISFPPIGKVNLLSKTVFEVEEAIAQRLKDGEFVMEPNVGCIVTAYAARQVPIVGAFRQMVDLPTHRNIRLLELLARAGTLDTTATTQADFSRVIVRRSGPSGRVINIEVDVDEVLDSGNETQNIIVTENDLIIIPTLQAATPQSADWVYVIGSVNNPGRHPIIRGRTPFTITKLIATVGDFAQFADRSSVKIIRHTETGRRFIELDFDEIIEGDLGDFELQADDLVVVPERFF